MKEDWKTQLNEVSGASDMDDKSLSAASVDISNDENFEKLYNMFDSLTDDFSADEKKAVLAGNVNNKFDFREYNVFTRSLGKKMSPLTYCILNRPDWVPEILETPGLKIDVEELKACTAYMSNDFFDGQAFEMLLLCTEKNNPKLEDIMTLRQANDFIANDDMSSVADFKTIKTLLDYPGANAAFQKYNPQYDDEGGLFTNLVIRGDINLLKDVYAAANVDLKNVNTFWDGDGSYSLTRHASFSNKQAECVDFLRNEKIAQRTNSAKEKLAAKAPQDNIALVDEFKIVLENKDFEKYIRESHENGKLKQILPEIDKLWSIPEKAEFHPEGNSGAHTLLVLKEAQDLDPKVKFALLLHDVGKTMTPQEKWPAHFGHDNEGVPLVKTICDRLQMPQDYKDFAVLVCQHHMKGHNFGNMKAAKLYDLNEEIPPRDFSAFIDSCRCDVMGRAAETPEQIEKKEAGISTFNIGVNKFKTLRHKFADYKAQNLTRDAILNQIGREKI